MDFTFVSSGPSYIHTVARSLCVSWAFLYTIITTLPHGNSNAFKTLDDTFATTNRY